MESPKGKGGKKGLISKTWERCKSFSGGIGGRHHPVALKSKSYSWPRGLIVNVDQARKKAKKWSWRVAPEGCFSIYVGPRKQRFVIKTEYLNHPLFKILLEEAESEYGYSCEGPLLLPCEVDHFIKLLVEMDSDHHKFIAPNARTHTSYHLLTPPRLIAMNYFKLLAR